jgi:transposase InsO family protein
MNTTIKSKAKVNCFKDYKNGGSVDKLTEKYGISRSTFYRWMHEMETPDKPVIPGRQDKKLMAEIERQKQVIEIFQKTGLGISSPFDQRIAAIQSLNGEYSLNLLCSTLDIAKATYYRAIEVRETQYSRKRKEYTPLIEKIFEESRQTYGARKISSILSDMGYHMAPKTVAEIMHNNGWFSVRSGAKKLYEQGLKRFTNHVCQQFDASEPDTLWASDMTEIKYNGFKYNICAVLDLFSRKVIAYSISMKPSTQLVNRTIKSAFRERQPRGPLTLHTDRGTVYASKAFNQTLKELGITHSYSAVSNPYDNAVCEAFFKTLKEEGLYRSNYHSEAEMKKSIAAYIERYNAERPHAYLNNTSPEKFEKKYFEKMRQPATEVGAENLF